MVNAYSAHYNWPSPVAEPKPSWISPVASSYVLHRGFTSKTGVCASQRQCSDYMMFDTNRYETHDLTAFGFVCVSTAWLQLGLRGVVRVHLPRVPSQVFKESICTVLQYFRVSDIMYLTVASFAATRVRA